MTNLPEEALHGKEFNKYFPQNEGDFKFIFTQEKKGFSLAHLSYQGSVVATVSISDAAANPSTIEKYHNAKGTLVRYPIVENGTKGTSVLVERRFQIHIRSKVDDFTSEHRESVIENFDYTGLAELA